MNAGSADRAFCAYDEVENAGSCVFLDRADYFARRRHRGGKERRVVDERFNINSRLHIFPRAALYVDEWDTQMISHSESDSDSVSVS